MAADTDPRKSAEERREEIVAVAIAPLRARGLQRHLDRGDRARRRHLPAVPLPPLPDQARAVPRLPRRADAPAHRRDLRATPRPAPRPGARSRRWARRTSSLLPTATRCSSRCRATPRAPIRIQAHVRECYGELVAPSRGLGRRAATRCGSSSRTGCCSTSSPRSTCARSPSATTGRRPGARPTDLIRLSRDAARRCAAARLRRRHRARAGRRGPLARERARALVRRPRARTAASSPRSPRARRRRRRGARCASLALHFVVRARGGAARRPAAVERAGPDRLGGLRAHRAGRQRRWRSRSRRWPGCPTGGVEWAPHGDAARAAARGVARRAARRGRHPGLHAQLRHALGARRLPGGRRPRRAGGWIRTTEPRALDAPLVAAMTDAWAPAAFAATRPLLRGADARPHDPRPPPAPAAGHGARRLTCSPLPHAARPSPACGRRTASCGRPAAS